MPLLLQLGLIFCALVAPGLVAVYLARAIAPSRELDPSAEDTILTAMTIAIALVSIEFVLLSASSALNGSLRIWIGLTLSELVSDDPWSVVQSRPEQVVLIASLEYTGHLVLLALLGWWNPFLPVQKGSLARRGIRHPHPVEDAVRGTPDELGTTVIYASAVLRDGRAYTGALQSVSLRPLSDGSRELFLQAVERIDGDRREPVGSEGAPSGLVLNTRDVVALELAYAEAASGSDGPPPEESGARA